MNIMKQDIFPFLQFVIIYGKFHPVIRMIISWPLFSGAHYFRLFLLDFWLIWLLWCSSFLFAGDDLSTTCCLGLQVGDSSIPWSSSVHVCRLWLYISWMRLFFFQWASCCSPARFFRGHRWQKCCHGIRSLPFSISVHVYPYNCLYVICPLTCVYMLLSNNGRLDTYPILPFFVKCVVQPLVIPCNIQVV